MTTQHEDAAKVALRSLDAMERRDLDEARACFAAVFTMVFPGPAEFKDLDAMVAASASRYRSIAKHIEATEAFNGGGAAGTSGDRDHVSVVYVRGTLLGVNLHGVPFEGVRFIDRFEVQGGLIRRQDVWNDLSESGVLARYA
ncbi:MAG: hypothetical protein ABI633_01530 [Burkholderiales bacterium]